MLLVTLVAVRHHTEEALGGLTAVTLIISV